MRARRILITTPFLALLATTYFLTGAPNEVKKIADGVWFREGDIMKEGHCNNVIIEMKDYLIIIDANFPSGARAVIADAKKSGAITSSVAAACSIKIAELGDIPERVALVRNKAMAHQHKLLKQNEAFNEAQITLKQMTKYSNVALEISAILKKAIGLEPIVVETQPAKTLKELLQYLEDRL